MAPCAPRSAWHAQRAQRRLRPRCEFVSVSMECAGPDSPPPPVGMRRGAAKNASQRRPATHRPRRGCRSDVGARSKFGFPMSSPRSVRTAATVLAFARPWRRGLGGRWGPRVAASISTFARSNSASAVAPSTSAAGANAVDGIRFGTSCMVRVTPLPRRPFFQTDRFRAMLAGRRLAFPDPGVIRLRWQWSGDRRCALLPSNEPRPASGFGLRRRRSQRCGAESRHC